MPSFRNACITWQKDWRGVHQSNSQRNMQRMVCGFFDFLARNQTFSLPEWYPELIGVCSDSTISSEIWTMEEKRVPRFQRKYLWKFQTCSFVGIPIPKTSENQPRSKLSAAPLSYKMSDFLLLKGESYWNPTCFGFKKSETKKNRELDDLMTTQSRWPYFNWIYWKFMRHFNISEMINDNMYQTFIPLLFGCFFWPVLGIEERHLAQLDISAKKDFGQFAGNKFIMPRRKAWIQTGDFSLCLMTEIFECPQTVIFATSLVEPDSSSWFSSGNSGRYWPCWQQSAERKDWRVMQWAGRKKSHRTHSVLILDVWQWLKEETSWSWIIHYKGCLTLYNDNLEVELSNLLDDSKWNYPL